MNSMNDIWQSVLEALGDELTKTSRATWFGDCAPVELREETHRRGVRYCLRAGDKLPNIKKMVELKVDYIPTNCIAPWY